MPLMLKIIPGVFSEDNIIQNVEVSQRVMWLETNRDKASPHLSAISQNKINQILKNNILFFLFFTLAFEVFSYVLSVFFGTET